MDNFTHDIRYLFHCKYTKYQLYGIISIKKIGEKRSTPLLHLHKLHHLVIFVYGSMTWAKQRNRIAPYSLNSSLLYFQCKEIHLNGVQTKFKCKLNVKRCKRFVFPPSSLLPHFNALKTKAIDYFQTVRTLTRIVSPPLKAPEVFVAKGRDGKTDMWGLIARPTNFDPNKKYPVIEYIYQGPGDQYVPKTFRPYDWNMTSLAELGFIVVMVDGMGTSFRSRAFENVCYKNLKDAGLPDHIAWIKAAARKYPYMDVDRVGIYGCSAGGQESTNAVLLYPDFYKAAYSACGCHDNRMDKIWWNELWLGYPVGDQYKEGSNVENAHLLSRPLMLVVGELDDNVDPASTMQVVNALIKANKDFELVVIPGAHHTMGEDFGEHKRYDFFVRHLMQVNPPKWDEIK